MKLVIQRVSRATVEVEGNVIASIGKGFLILIGVEKSDDGSQIPWLANKTAQLRIFEDENGKMNRNLIDVDGEVLLVSQFTLYADCNRGRRPGFDKAAPPDLADRLYLKYGKALEDLGIKVRTGEFGAHMQVSLNNDGPVTIILER
jgi:D-tyrosyl-tRNA(Tyr) deacylase